MTVAVRLVVDVLATFRLTKLVTDDVIATEVREAVVRWAYRRAGREAWGDEQRRLVEHGTWTDDVVPNDADPPKLAVLVTCPWCSGAWLALAVVVARRLTPRAWAVAGEALALSAAAGLVAESRQHA